MNLKPKTSPASPIQQAINEGRAYVIANGVRRKVIAYRDRDGRGLMEHSADVCCSDDFQASREDIQIAPETALAKGTTEPGPTIADLTSIRARRSLLRANSDHGVDAPNRWGSGTLLAHVAAHVSAAQVLAVHRVGHATLCSLQQDLATHGLYLRGEKPKDAPPQP